MDGAADPPAATAIPSRRARRPARGSRPTPLRPASPAARVALLAGGDSTGRAAGSPAAEEPDLGLQPYAALLPHRPLGQIHQGLDVDRARPAFVHDEVRVPLGDARPPRP